jgi:rhamnogalacturonyl hydrolase YesR
MPMIRMLARALAALLLVAVGSAAAKGPELPVRSDVRAAMERMADWQLAHLDDLSYIPALRSDTSNARDWQQATFWVALTQVADRSASPRFREAIFAKGSALGWRLGDRLYHADDQLIGVAWLWAYAHGAGPEALAPLRAQFDRQLAAPRSGSLEHPEDGKGNPNCFDRWCWCDALFMAPPTLWKLSKTTGDPRYAAFADTEYRATHAYLFDKDAHLFYRDSRFFARRGAHGEKLFWSRGNGWVFSGLARLIPEIPAKDPRRAFYVALFREMAAKLVTLQRPNGYWPPSLLGDPATAADETSGTGFYTHGLAWGIKAGLLPRAHYLPAVVRGWEALNRAIQPDGRLGWVQQVSDRPDAVAANDTQFYGTGAYLLAGAAVYDLAKERKR